MAIAGEDRRATGAHPIAIDGDEAPAGLSEVLDGVLQIAVALMSVAATFALNLYALSAIIR